MQHRKCLTDVKVKPQVCNKRHSSDSTCVVVFYPQHAVHLLVCCLHCLPCSYLCQASPEPWLSASQFLQPCQRLAKAHMLQQLTPCDLELQQQSRAGAQRLLTLPFDVLLELLHSHETRVAAESTVAGLINTWLAAQPAPATAEQKLQLACCLRLRGMPAYYLEQVRLLLLLLLDACVCIRSAHGIT
jgi:hypothetical protein